MSTKFKYPVIYQCSSEKEQQELFTQLEEIGYTAKVLSHYSGNKYIGTNAGYQTNFCTNYISNSGTDDKYTCNSKELFLALASMRDSDEFFVGEWVTQKDWSADSIYKLVDINEHSNVVEWTMINGSKAKSNYPLTGYLIKATKQQIINKFSIPKETVKEINTTMKYKIGDSVKIIKRTHTSNNSVGDIGIITDVEPEDYTGNLDIRVAVPGVSGDWWENSNNVELYIEPVKTTKTTMKKFKNKVSITGTRSLLKAAGQELEILGYTIDKHSPWNNPDKDVLESVLINTDDETNGIYGYYNHTGSGFETRLQLPQDWDTMLELAAEVEIEEPVKGQWYIVDKNYLINFQRIGSDNYGFYIPKGFKTEWISEMYWNKGDKFVLADKELVKQHLLAEAERRYSAGDYVKSIFSTFEGTLLDEKPRVELLRSGGHIWWNGTQDTCNVLVYEAGKWANKLDKPEEYVKLLYSGTHFNSHSDRVTIDGIPPAPLSSVIVGNTYKVLKHTTLDSSGKNGGVIVITDGKFSYWLGKKSTITPETIVYEPSTEANYIESIKPCTKPKITVNGYDALFRDTHVEFGCAKFHMSMFVQLWNAHNIINANPNTNRSINSITIGSGTFTMSQIQTIAEYYTK